MSEYMLWAATLKLYEWLIGIGYSFPYLMT